MAGPMPDAAAATGGALPRVVVVGGGVAGAALAMHLMRGAAAPLDIALVEPRAVPGQGLAYATRDPGHRINVPSDRMPVFADRPRDFTDWMEETGRRAADPEGEDGTGAHYSRRADFGAYMAARLAETAAQAAGRHRFAHLCARATAVTVMPDGTARVTLSDGRVLAAWRVILATSHDRPAPPPGLDPAAAAHPGYVPDPWADGALDGIGRDASVAILGTGLTMVDVVAALAARGHRGPVLAVSRRGLLPRPHGAFDPVADVLARHPAPATAREGLRLARDLVRDAALAGHGWHHAVDGLRRDAETIWRQWSAAEQARALARLRPFWDVHRFRIAPQLAAQVAAAQAEGRLVVRRGRIVALRAASTGFALQLAPPGADRAETVAVDAVVNCLGPRPDITRRDDPLLAGLFASGLARPDPHRLGLAVDDAHRLTGGDGHPQPALRAVGPLTRGIFWELVGVPELAAHCARLAATLTAERARIAPGEPVAAPDGRAPQPVA